MGRAVRELLYSIPCKNKYPRCLFDPGWLKSVDMDYVKNIIKCIDVKCKTCPENIIYGYDLSVCTCPVAKLIASSIQNVVNEANKTGLHMAQVKTALVVSQNREIRNRFASFVENTGNAYVTERDQASALINVLEYPFSIMVVDADHSVDEVVDFMRVLKNLRPCLPIMVLLDAELRELEMKCINEGAACCFFKEQDEVEFSGKFIDLMECI